MRANCLHKKVGVNARTTQHAIARRPRISRAERPTQHAFIIMEFLTKLLGFFKGAPAQPVPPTPFVPPVSDDDDLDPWGEPSDFCQFAHQDRLAAEAEQEEQDRQRALDQHFEDEARREEEDRRLHEGW